MSGDVFIYDAVRAPRGKGKAGAPLSNVLPHELVGQLIDELERRHGVVRDHTERFTLSCVGQTGAQGGHLGLVSKLQAALNDDVVVHTVNNYCVGGLTAVGNTALAIRAGEADLALAGGVEMMSHVPFGADQASFFTDREVSAALSYAPPGIGADYLAHTRDVSRQKLDEWALRSHSLAAAAWNAGRYDNWVLPIVDRDGVELIARDETIAELSSEKLAGLAPVFAAMAGGAFDAMLERERPGMGPIDHRHTIAHCPPIADGASVILLGSAEAGERYGLTPLARLVHLVEAGGDPITQLTAGVKAMDRVLDRGGWSLTDMDVVEYMEAFAVVPALFERRDDVDMDRVNVNGGHLAMGHPMGATGAILITATVAEMRRTGAARGITVAHGGAGVGVAAVLESV